MGSEMCIRDRFYTRPTTVADIVDHTVTRALDQIGVDPPSKTRWSGRG